MAFPNLKKALLGFLFNEKLKIWGKRLIFAVGGLSYLAAQVFLIVLPAMNRTAPVETDDAYTYLLKAAEMRDCFLQNCPALNDLRGQLGEPSADPDIRWLRYREYVRAFSVYHPLHSLAIVGFYQVGFSWETAYRLISIGGGLAITLAVVYWLNSLFGSGPAGIAALLLAFTIFPNQGLYYIVPSNLALGIAMLAWGLILNRNRGSHWVVLISTLALVTMHPVGRLYALVTVGLYFFQNWKHLSRKTWLFAGICLSVVAITFILPLLISRPYLSFPADPPPAVWQSWWGYYNNFTTAGDYSKPWLDSFGGVLPAIFFVAVGLFSLAPSQKRSRVLAQAVLLGGLLLASLFQVLPHYPAEAFSRVWIPFAILLTGAAALAVWRWAAVCFHFVSTSLKAGFPEFRDEKRVLSPAGWGVVFFLVSSVALSQILIDRSLEGRRSLFAKQNDMVNVQNTLLEPSQPAVLLASGCGQVLYLAEVPMHYYLVHGALNCGAVYYPALAGTAAEKQWVQENPELNFIVTWNPAIASRVTGGGSPLALNEGDTLDFRFPDHWASKSVYLYLENHGSGVALDVFGLPKEPKGDPQKLIKQIALPAGWSGWQEIDTVADGLRLGMAQAGGQVVIRGIKSNLDTSRNWPWDEGLSLAYDTAKSDNAVMKISFDTASLFTMPNSSLEVIDDFGDTVLVKIIK